MEFETLAPAVKYWLILKVRCYKKVNSQEFETLPQRLKY